MNTASLTQCFNTYACHSIKRNGIDKLLGWLAQTDFYTAPASAKYHGAFQNGLIAHSIHTYVALITLNKSLHLKCSDESVAICGLLHDICKVNFYEPYYKNIKVYKPDGMQSDAGGRFNWEQELSYKIREDNKYPIGHGEKSVLLLRKFMPLNPEEELAVRWHMGGFDDAVKGGGFDISKAYRMSSLCVITHMADLAAAHIYDVEFQKKITGQAAQPTADTHDRPIYPPSQADPISDQEISAQPTELSASGLETQLSA